MPGESESWRRWTGISNIKISRCGDDRCLIRKTSCVVKVSETIYVSDNKIEFPYNSCGFSIGGSITF